MFFVGVVCTFVVYAVDSRDSFNDLDGWLRDAKEKTEEDSILILVGNKSDSLEREVSYEEGMNFLKKNNMDVFFETSAKTGENVEKVWCA
jgi:Ras-related protein Rab-2A